MAEGLICSKCFRTLIFFFFFFYICIFLKKMAVSQMDKMLTVN